MTEYHPLPQSDELEAAPPPSGTSWFARHTVAGTVGAVFLALAVISIVTGGGDRKPRGEDAAAAIPAPEGGEAYGDGDYVVGRDLPEGTYVSEGARSEPPVFCSVTTEPNDSGKLPQFRSGARDDRIEITLDSRDGVVTVRGCRPLMLRQHSV